MKAKNNISNYNSKELRELAPTLSKIEQQNSFQVPDSYFDTLPTIIQERCIEKKRPMLPEWLQLILNPRVLAPVLIVIVLVSIGINFFISPTPDPSLREGRANLPTGQAGALNSFLIDKDALLSLAQLSSEDIYATIEAGDLHEIDEYLIVEALIDIENEGEESDGEIIDYLMDNDIELSTIINAL